MMKTLKHYEYIKVFAEGVGAIYVKSTFSLRTSFAIEKLRDDFFMLSAGLLKQHRHEKSDEFHIRFSQAQKILTDKIEAIDAANSHRWRGISNQLIPISFNDVVQICPDSVRMRVALQKLDNSLVGPFCAKKLGLISRDEFKDAISPYKDAWREFITVILPKPTQTIL